MEIYPKDFALCSHNTFIDLWPFIDVVRACCVESVYVYHPKGFTEILNKVENQIYRLKWCKEVCFAHQAWACFDFETTDSSVLAKRIKETQDKLSRIAARYPARKKSN